MTFNGFIPPEQNFSKLPHEFIDLLPDIDSLAELKVTLYILRHTWGFSEYDKPKRITTDEFENGRKRKDGSRMDKGTGLSSNSIRSGLEKAVERGTLLVEVDDTDKARVEKYYSLNMSDDSNLAPRSAKVAPRPSKVEDRTEKETKERKEKIFSSSDKTVDAILELEKQAQEAKQSGSWQGRELVQNHLLIFADWWNKRTGQEMKGKARTDWLKEFTRWYEEQISISALDEAFDHVKSWKRIVSKPSDITNDALAINSLPKSVNNSAPAISQEGGIFV